MLKYKRCLQKITTDCFSSIRRDRGSSPVLSVLIMCFFPKESWARFRAVLSADIIHLIMKAAQREEQEELQSVKP